MPSSMAGGRREAQWRPVFPWPLWLPTLPTIQAEMPFRLNKVKDVQSRRG